MQHLEATRSCGAPLTSSILSQLARAEAVQRFFSSSSTAASANGAAGTDAPPPMTNGLPLDVTSEPEAAASHLAQLAARRMQRSADGLPVQAGPSSLDDMRMCRMPLDDRLRQLPQQLLAAAPALAPHTTAALDLCTAAFAMAKLKNVHAAHRLLLLADELESSGRNGHASSASVLRALISLSTDQPLRKASQSTPSIHILQATLAHLQAQAGHKPPSQVLAYALLGLGQCSNEWLQQNQQQLQGPLSDVSTASRAWSVRELPAARTAMLEMTSPNNAQTAFQPLCWHSALAVSPTCSPAWMAAAR